MDGASGRKEALRRVLAKKKAVVDREAAAVRELKSSLGASRVEVDAAVEALKPLNVEAKGVTVSGKNAKDAKYAALNTFSESGLPAQVLDCCKNFSKPSPIQSHAWPFLLGGRDFVGIVATGSGKTLAFGVPALMHILKKKETSNSKK